ISKSVAEALVRAGVARQRIAIIPSGVDCSRFAPPSRAERQQARAAIGLTVDDIAIGAIGALVPRKGHRVLLAALALAVTHGAAGVGVGRLRCFIAGGRPLGPGLAGHLIPEILSDWR